LASVEADESCPAQDVWPGADWADRSDEAATSAADAITAFEAYAFPADLDWSDKKRRGVRTDGVVILKDGQLVYERYDGGYDRDTPHLAWSVSKTFTNVLAGIAVHQGLLTEDDSLCQWIDGLPSENCDITLAHALEFSTGLDWLESYEDASPTHSSVAAMLYGEGTGDMAAFVASHPRAHEPGTAFMYSSGDTNLIAALAGKALQPTYGEHWPWEVLFDRIGMEKTTFERDGAGNYVGSSWVWAPPRHLARLGWLLMNDGCWEGERLVPEGWVAKSVTAGEGFRSLDLDANGYVNGRQIWLNTPVPEAGITERPWPDVPETAYSALGVWKQAIFVAPEQGVVVVRTGDDRDGTFDWNTFFSLALALAEDA
jgi:CubicO group peptidase (beta-lactamase class C family)